MTSLSPQYFWKRNLLCKYNIKDEKTTRCFILNLDVLNTRTWHQDRMCKVLVNYFIKNCYLITWIWLNLDSIILIQGLLWSIGNFILLHCLHRISSNPVNLYRPKVKRTKKKQRGNLIEKKVYWLTVAPSLNVPLTFCQSTKHSTLWNILLASSIHTIWHHYNATNLRSLTISLKVPKGKYY